MKSMTGSRQFTTRALGALAWATPTRYGRAYAQLVLSLASICALAECRSASPETDAGGAAGAAEGGAGGLPEAGGAGPAQAGTAGTVDTARGKPLLDQAGDARYDCRVTRPAARLNPDPWQGFFLSGTDGGAFLTRMEGEDSAQLTCSTIEQGGSLGPTNVIARPAGTALVSSGTSVLSDGGFALLWSEEEQHRDPADPEGGEITSVSRLEFIRVDETGAVVGEAQTVVDTSSYVARSAISATEQGYLVVWGQFTDDTETLRSVLLDENGAALGAPTAIVEGSLASLVATKTGFGITYAIQGGNQSVTRYQALDSQGAPRGTAFELESDYATTTTSLLARGSEILVAWTHREGDFDAQQAASVLMLRRLDERGTALGPAYYLDAPIEDEQDAGPLLLTFGPDVILFWGHGQINYGCSGCMPDDSLRFVILDGEDLVPQSKVLRLVNPETSGGLTVPQAILLGSDILVASRIQYHATADQASATIHCE